VAGKSKMNKKGFTLIEVVLSLFLLAILAGLTSISFLHTGPKYRLQKAVWEISSRLNYARYNAIFNGVKIRIRFENSAYSVEYYEENQEQWVRKDHNFLEGVTIRANNSPVFHPQGTVSNLASIYISNSWGEYRISIAISGRIKSVRTQ
jgi:prepilin-type N-terminal cleavage/methylation domain-containing protein